MKRSIFLFVVLMIVAVTFGLVACDSASDDVTDDTPNNYIIQYTDEYGVRQITVTDGMPYSMEWIPQKTGYTFKGLFDSKVGGTQYTDESGMALMVFTDKKNLILFPQFEPIEYRIILNYDNAEYGGDTNFVSVDYDSEIPVLPSNLTKYKMSFAGWFSKPDGKGVQITDANGCPINKTVLNATNYGYTSSKEINLYAYFTYDNCNVKIFLSDGKIVEKEVPYNCKLDDIELPIGEQRVLYYSTDFQGKEKFQGNITDDMVLYAAIVYKIVFKTSMGSLIDGMYVAADTNVTLRKFTGGKFNFLGWEYNGVLYTENFRMPKENVILNAKWATTDNWIPVSTKEDFASIKNNLSGKYFLTNDIDLGEWTPLGDYCWEVNTGPYEMFTGRFDGDNYKIKYKITMGDLDERKTYSWGIWGSVYNATIENLNVNVYVNIDGTIKDCTCAYAGGVVGWMKESTISNCNVSGNITLYGVGGKNYGIARGAGIAGKAYSSRFVNVHNRADLYVQAFNAAAAGICAGVDNLCTFDNWSNIGRYDAKHDPWVNGAIYYDAKAIDMSQGKGRKKAWVQIQPYD